MISRVKIIQRVSKGLLWISKGTIHVQVHVWFLAESLWCFYVMFLCVFSAFIEHSVAISPSSFSSVSREKGLLCYTVVYSSYLLSQYSVEADSLHVCSNCLPWFSETNHSWLILQGRSSLGNPVNSYDFRCLFSFLDVCPHYLDFNPLNYDIQITLIMCCFWVCSYISSLITT